LASENCISTYVIAATPGIRRGEVLGLKWQDVDLGAGLVSVIRSLTVVGGYEVPE
jgi:integrase